MSSPLYNLSQALSALMPLTSYPTPERPLASLTTLPDDILFLIISLIAPLDIMALRFVREILSRIRGTSLPIKHTDVETLRPRNKAALGMGGSSQETRNRQEHPGPRIYVRSQVIRHGTA